MASHAVESSPGEKREGFFSGKKGRGRREALTAYTFLLPSFIVLLVFNIFPVFYALYVSLHKWFIKQGAFVGIDNYLRLLGEPLDILMFIAGAGSIIAAWFVWRSVRPEQSNTSWVLRLGAAILLILGGWLLLTGFPRMYAHGDERLFKSLVVTIFYSMGTVPLQLILGLSLAILLFQKIKGKSLFRVIYFLPYITPAVASAAVWMAIFEPKRGLINSTLAGLFGIADESLPQWLWEATGINQSVLNTIGINVDLPWLLAGPSLALIAVIIYNIWVFTGYNAVLFLAGLGGIPFEMYEAAKIDGAGRWALFRHITLPLLSPTTFFLTMVGIIGTFQAVNHIFVMTQVSGITEPQFTTATNTIYIWERFRVASRYGYASAIAFILFGIILILTRIQTKVQGERVHYG